MRKLPKSILNKDFVYHDSNNTDIRRTFARVRKQLKAEEEARLSGGRASGKLVPLPLPGADDAGDKGNQRGVASTGGATRPRRV